MQTTFIVIIILILLDVSLFVLAHRLDQKLYKPLTRLRLNKAKSIFSSIQPLMSRLTALC
jgi:hypothetical protein